MNEAFYAYSALPLPNANTEHNWHCIAAMFFESAK